VIRAVDAVPWSPEKERDVFAAYLEVAIRHRDTGPALLRDMSAVLAAYEDSVDELIDAMRKFHVWLAGPDALPSDLLRASAATEVVGAVLSSGVTAAQASDELTREVLLDVVLAVLGRREGRRSGP
jgi:hypothetical protein